MATEINTGGDGGSGGTSFLAFIVGGLLVLVAVVGFFMWDGYKSGGGAPKAPAQVNLTVKK